MGRLTSFAILTKLSRFLQTKRTSLENGRRRARKAEKLTILTDKVLKCIFSCESDSTISNVHLSVILSSKFKTPKTASSFHHPNQHHHSHHP